MASAEHHQDSDCTVDPKTDCCTECGVYHASPCPWCDGRGFHNPGCELLKDDDETLLEKHAADCRQCAKALFDGGLHGYPLCAEGQEIRKREDAA